MSGQRFSRREAGKLALFSAAALDAAQAQPAAGAAYHGALDGFDKKVDMTAFDTLAFSRGLYESAPLRLTFAAKNGDDARRWQRELRAKVLELTGGFPASTPLEPQTLEVREFPGYRREKFVFRSRPGAAVLGYLLTPAQGKAPYPAVVCIPGHGRGVDDIVGIDERGRDRTVKVGYAYDYAIQVVEHGMAAIAIEAMGFGCRRDPASRSKDLTASSCQPASGAALLFGQTMIGWRVYDVVRTLDWMESRKELDARRAGVMGCSGGGACTVFAAALDTRIKAAFASSYLNTFRDSILSISHCIDNYVPGILNWAEMYDVAGLIAPRAFFAESGARDEIFPIAASRASFERVKRIYEVLGAGGMTGQEVFDGPHQFWGKQGLPFLRKALG